MRGKHVSHFLTLIALCVLLAGNLSQAANTLKLGITKTDGRKYNVEFEKYDRFALYLKSQGIQATLFDYQDFYRQDIPVNVLYNKLTKFNIILLRSREEGIHHFTGEFATRAENVSKALQKYVRNGGGLVIQPRPVRYPNDDDEKYWNTVYKPFGIKVLHEGIFDKANQVDNEIRSGRTFKFFYTTNRAEHNITKNTKGFWLPMRSYYPNAGTPAIQYAPDWQVILRGEPTAKSYQTHHRKNILQLDKEGTYKSAPPIVATRELGKGRIVCFPIDMIYSGLNLGNNSWSHIVENKGANNKQSDVITLLANAIKWAGEPSEKEAGLGTHKTPAYQRISFNKSYSWDSFKLNQPVKGIIGAHTDLTDGTGTVADYVKAAKNAGLSFIVFTEPLEKLTKAKLNQLKKACRKQSDSKFYACPGIEFTDGSGIRWIFYSNKIEWPLNTFKKGKYTYKLWDGKVIKHYGKYLVQCNFCPSAVIDYKQLRSQGAVPENMWWFYNVIPYAYDDTKLIADNFDEWLFALRDLRYVSPISFTRIKSPDMIPAAFKTAFTGMKDLEKGRKALNTRCTPYWKARSARQFTSFGGNVEVTFWDAVNPQMEQNWQYTKGAQRVKAKFTVTSPAGIADVKIYDADYGMIRRFISANKEAIFSREFELNHDKQHYLTLVATDTQGNKAVSSFLFIYCYKQGLFRCGDNLNILGALGMYWHPDRNQMFHLNKDFRNGELYSIQGWDRGGPDCPMPEGRLCDWINIKGVGEYPWPGNSSQKLGKRMNVKLAGHNLQIAEMKMDSMVERYDNKDRPGPAFCSIARKVEDNPYFERIDRLIAPMDRMDHFIAWNHRRLREGIEKYQGSYLWHEGEIKIKQDITLQGSIPIPLAWMTTPFDYKNNLGTLLVVKDADKGVFIQKANADDKKQYTTGTIKGGGFAAHMNAPVGYMGVIIPEGYEFTYHSSLPGRLYVGLGKSGQHLKAGTVLKYAYLSGDFIDHKNNADRMTYVSNAFNMSGGAKGYPIDMKVGNATDATFFFTAEADKNEALFTLGPKKDIGIDLPIRVNGLTDNGCAAIYSTNRSWFRFIPVVNGTAYLQEPIDNKNEIWIGNVFVSDNKAVKINLVIDGQNQGKKPFLDIHNPTEKAIKTQISSPAHTPLFGGTKITVTIPAGSSVRHIIQPLH